MWRKSTRSDSNGGACVEVAGNLPGVVGVRQQGPAGPLLSFTTDQWIGFVQGVRDGTLDA
ncbi:DUF397 domain-containing protein [Verrucosispora sp. TAA-831]|uniref:DUF397 domain-containing protein n=1 Tax=Verrucosispora sp. TAA-831 TaxID=3422227 RepID=UPI003D6E7C2D